MDTLHHSGAYVMPPALREVLAADPEGNRWAGFEAAMAYARAGFRVLPIVRGGKAPERRGPFQHGANSATSDVEAVRDAFVFDPDLNVGTGVDPWFIMVDIDPRHGGSLEAAEQAGVPVDGHRERSGSGGWHLPLTMPLGTQALRSATIAPGVEVKTAGSYAVSPHSRLADGGWYRVEPGRDTWAWPMIPDTWRHLHRLTDACTPAKASATIQITAGDAAKARGLRKQLLASRYGDGVRAVLRMQAEYPRRSDADFQLLLAASHFTEDRTILTALLTATSQKLRDHADPPAYLATTLDNVLRARQRRNADRLDVLRLALGLPVHAHPDTRAIDADRNARQDAAHFPLLDAPSLAQPGRPATPAPTSTRSSPAAPTTRFTPPPAHPTPPVLVGTFVSPMDHGEGIVRWLTGTVPPAYELEEGLRRVPVDDLAVIFGVNRKTIWRKLKALEAKKWIVYDPTDHRSDKGPRRDSRARWIGGET